MNPGLFSGLAIVLRHDDWRCELITRYRLCAERRIATLNKLYPGEDMELPVTTALYLAAMTYERGRNRAHFAVWLRHKIRGQLMAIKRRQNRARWRVHSLDSTTIDRHLYYREQEIDPWGG